MITPELRAEIRRLFYAEHWRVGTIVGALKIHRDTVLNAIESERFNSAVPRIVRPSMLDPFVPFIRDTLVRYPKLRATRIFEMIRQRGFAGQSPVQLRRLVARLRPRPAAEAYLRLRVLPAEQAQVDWGSFDRIRIGRATRPLSCFVMVLSWSRAIHALFTVDQTLESFLRGHVEAFQYFGGVARSILYDNLKSAVLERRGDAIRFHPRLLEFCGHYHFAPRPCAPARGNEKGRVERAIQYLRTSFIAARTYRDLDDLNAQFRRWRDEIAHARSVPNDKSMTVADALAHERNLLLPLPEHPFETDLVRAVSSGKTPYIRFDCNLYSIPHKLAQQPLTLVASPTTVRLLNPTGAAGDRGTDQIACHKRSYDKGVVVENPAHVEELAAAKRNARLLTGRDCLRAAVPETDELFTALAERGEALGHHTVRLKKLLDEYGAQELRVAVIAALNRRAPSAGAVAHILEQRRRAKGLPPPVPVALPDDPRIRDLRLTPSNLENYDELAKPPKK
ncbi:MAG: IS21 family transposase [Pseudomonadota bacterium]